MDNSDSDDIVLSIDLYYVLDKEGLHDMDAEVHKKCGACVIDVLNHLSDVLDVDCQLNFAATQEGGVREYFYNVPYCHEIALMSIQPKYAEKIAKGEEKSSLERRYLHLQ